jgi:hypothetical protein
MDWQLSISSLLLLHVAVRKWKANIYPCIIKRPTRKAFCGSEGIDPRTSNLYTRWKFVASLHYPFYRKFGALYDWSGRSGEEINLAPFKKENTIFSSYVSWYLWRINSNSEFLFSYFHHRNWPSYSTWNKKIDIVIYDVSFSAEWV